LASAETVLETLSFSSLSMKLTVSGSIVKDILERCLIRYFGKEDSVRIESFIKVICEECFCSCESVLSVVFEGNSQ
jgi:predicted nucleic acid-binding Zn finger protein